MSYKLTILGANSATPAYGRHHTAQLLQIGRHHFLIDCGEATQERLTLYKANTWKIKHIFISHLHGDHYLGLMGLIFTMHLMRRPHDLHIYGQRGLQEIITLQLKYSDSRLNYKIVFHELDPNSPQVIFEDDQVSVTSFPLNHRIPCCGFLFKEQPKPFRLNKEKLPATISLQAIAQLKQGRDATDEQSGQTYLASELTLPPRKSLAYAFCSDTCYDESLTELLKEVDLLYHEATFLKEKLPWAKQTFHSTTHEAGTIAKLCGAQKLLIGHYSARYKDLTPFLEETREVFPNTELALEGECHEVTE